MIMLQDYILLQRQYELIRAYFRTTCEHFDSLDWNGNELEITLNDVTIEKYTFKDLCGLIPYFEYSTSL